MKELEETDFPKVLQIYKKAEIDFPLIRTVIERKQKGRIWVDRAANPSSALVCTKFGFTYLFGDENKEFNTDVEKLIFEESNFDCRYLLWYNPPKFWREKMDKMSDVVRRRTRIQFKFNRRNFEKYLAKKIPEPEGFVIRRIDEKLFEKAAVFDLNLESRFWSSAEDFLKNGFGFCAMKGEEMVSIIYSACVVNKVAEIDVATLKEYRGMGLATNVTTAFIEHCIKVGITPSWDAFDYNEPSLKVAKKVGFEERIRYPFYTLNRDKLLRK